MITKVRNSLMYIILLHFFRLKKRLILPYLIYNVVNDSKSKASKLMEVRNYRIWENHLVKAAMQSITPLEPDSLFMGPFGKSPYGNSYRMISSSPAYQC